MTTFEADNTIQENVNVHRPVANFPPSVWGDRFLSFSLDNEKLEAYAKAMAEPKEELKRLIADPSMASNSKLSLINSLYRLGLNYLFFEEINSELDKLFKKFNLEDCNEMDLYTISLNFLVFRQHGYKLSSDVFNKFKDFGSGKFKECIVSDVKGMLIFYECTHLRIHGESILDEALAFTESKLKGMVDTLEGNIERQVKHALAFPSHLGLPVVEAKLYFANYQEECSAYDPLRKLAIAHFNYFQLLQKEELRILSKWYKDMKFETITPYTREKLPELYLWMLTVYLEPHYSEARIITTKISQLVLVLDDTFDAYGTIEELRLITDAINKWDMSAMEQLPDYIKPFYQIILNEYDEFEKQLMNKEGRANVVNASKRAFQDLARAYLQEAEWRHSGVVPTFEEYLENGLVTSAFNLLAKSVLIGNGENVSEEALAWYESHPKFLQAAELISRLHNDAVSFEFERERAQLATGVEAYMKTFEVTENVAVNQLKKLVENAWKDLNEGCLMQRVLSLDVLSTVVSLSRVVYVVYRFNDDGFTFSHKTLKDYIALLVEDFIPK